MDDFFNSVYNSKYKKKTMTTFIKSDMNVVISGILIHGEKQRPTLH